MKFKSRYIDIFNIYFRVLVSFIGSIFYIIRYSHVLIFNGNILSDIFCDKIYHKQYLFLFKND